MARKGEELEKYYKEWLDLGSPEVKFVGQMLNLNFGSASVSPAVRRLCLRTTDGAGYDYQYYLGDNLGNTRVTFGTKTGAVVPYQTDDYYPFGLEILRTTPAPNPKNEYLYNKKELQEELGQYDYGARFYDPVIARWNTIDPLVSFYDFFTPYAYVANNPTSFIDPDGRSINVDSFGTVTFDNVGTDDALNAAYVLQGKRNNIYVDVEGNPETRKKEKESNNKGKYGGWAVFAAENMYVAATALESIVQQGQLNNLVIESHGHQSSESGIDLLDNGSTNNFLWNSDIAKVVGTANSKREACCDDIEARVDQLRKLADLVKNNGNLILAVCDAGKGKAGQEFGENINLLTGERLNTFLPTAFVHGAVGTDSRTKEYVEWLPGSFWVDSFQSPGWIKVSKTGQISNIESIKLNIGKTGAPIKINPWKKKNKK